MEGQINIRYFNEIYADLTAEELIALYRWVQAEELLTPRNGILQVSNYSSITHKPCRD